ncbi:MAG TPA: hypothetical protein VMV20_07295 [Chitinophagaceae bacterium]|nr:hypothetical protein [Chitinophagaceae bacterium]
MKSLSETWFVDGPIDFEHKKYKLLAYLQDIGRLFSQNMLYPQLSDLVFHYNSLSAFREHKEVLQKFFPKRLSALNLEKLQVIYNQMIEDDDLMQEIWEIIEYSLGTMNDTIRQGTEIYDLVEARMNISPVGIIPLHTREGYMLLRNGRAPEIQVYRYRITIFHRHDEKYCGIHTEFITDYRKSFSHTYETVKSDLIHQRSDLPNPAVYSVETGLTFPMEETLLPVARRSLVKFISRQAA